MKRSTRFYGPMIELSRLQSELNRLFTTFVETNKGIGASASGWDPNIDLLEDGEKIRVLVELPGVEAEDLKLTIRGRVLTVRGAKKGRIRSREGIRFFCMERYFGNFVKSISLPRAVNTHQARTALKDGLLEVVLPLVPEQREKEFELPIHAGDGQ